MGQVQVQVRGEATSLLVGSPGRSLRLAALALVVICASERVSEAYFVHGRVLADGDGDGRASAADVPLAGVIVVFQAEDAAHPDEQWLETDSDGSFGFMADGDGLAWVRTPDGFAPGPNWTVVRADEFTLVLVPRPVSGPLRFVQASDLHMGHLSVESTHPALLQATGGTPAPDFLLLTGDLTQSSKPGQYDDYEWAAEGVEIPIVPVLGNHDWADKGAGWRSRLGPMQWSFDAGGVHFVVLNGEASTEERLAFLDRDLVHRRPGQMTVATQHFPISLPNDQALFDGLVARGVSHLFTGHFHASSHFEYEGLTEHNVQPLVFGGLDGMPAGYQVVTIADGQVSVRELDFTEHAVFEAIAPRPDRCIGAVPFEIIAAVQDGPGEHTVRASIDGEAAQLLPDRGGWDFALAHAALVAGEHTLRLTLTTPGRADRQLDSSFCVTSMPDPVELPAWPQLGGAATHEGRAGTTVRPPLEMHWARTVGGHIHAPPVLDAGRLFVPVADYGTGPGSGIVALDARSGTPLWRFASGAGVHASAAVAHDVVVFASVDGWLRGLDAATGTLRWQVRVDPGHEGSMASLYAAPVIVGDLACVGTIYRFIAVDVVSGTLRWQSVPGAAPFFDPSHATAAASGGLVVAPFGRRTGVFAEDALSGAPHWSLDDPIYAGITAAPVIDDDQLFLVSSSTVASALGLGDGQRRWKHKIDKDGFEYGFWTWATPALGGKRLVLASKQSGLVALETDHGKLAWSLPVGDSVVHTIHLEARTHGVSSSPVITGDVVWSAGDDGVLRAAALESGLLLWQIDLGSPLLGGVIPSGHMLYVAGWDGSVRALMVDEDAQVGCCVGAVARQVGTGAAGAGLLALLVVAVLRSRRRSR